MQLYNKLSADDRAKLIAETGEERLTLSFYQYAHIGNPELFRNYLFLTWDKLGVLGRTYVAKEGINAQISIVASNFNEFKAHLDSIPFLYNVRLNIAREQDNFSFLKLKIKVKSKIVADGLNDDSFDVTNKGIHLNAEEFNEIIEDEDTLLIDMRNHYESEIGHFKGAVTPDVDTFRESLPIIEDDYKDFKKSKKLVMYCTGGIRCEKASAYFKHKGFDNVFQLEGGIIEYARQTTEKNLPNKFIGKNFVFDQRLGERISNDVIAHCHQCGKPNDDHINCANDGCHLLFIQCPECREKMQGCCSEKCIDVIKLSPEEQKELRKGIYKPKMIFKKGRSEAIKFKQD